MSTQSPEQTVADADRALADAQQDVTALEGRVINGDATVTPDQVETAHGLRRFAQLRRAAAQKRAEQAAAREAEERRTAALAEARRLLDETSKADVDELAADARRAVAALANAVDAYNANAQAAWSVMATGRAVPNTPFDPAAPPRPAGTPEGLAWGYSMGSPVLLDNGLNVLSLDKAGILARAARER